MACVTTSYCDIYRQSLAVQGPHRAKSVADITIQTFSVRLSLNIMQISCQELEFRASLSYSRVNRQTDRNSPLKTPTDDGPETLSGSWAKKDPA